MVKLALVLVVLVLTTVTNPARAAEFQSRLDAAKAFQQKGDLARAAHELEVALTDLQDRLGRSLMPLMPKPLAGWQGEEAEYEGLGGAGGGLSITRAYTKEDASLNASIIIDNPVVDGPPDRDSAPGTVKKIKMGNDEAALRWDSQANSGEITMVLSKRVLLQIEGEGIASGDILVEQAKGFDVAAIRKALMIN